MSTLHLTNWSSRTQHGPGRAWCVMASPRSWEHGHGRIGLLAPQLQDLQLVKAGRISHREYFNRYAGGLRPALLSGALAPGKLQAVADGVGVLVDDGDTLCCACARPGSAARQHRCHLEELAPILREAGWQVVLYGVSEPLALFPVR